MMTIDFVQNLHVHFRAGYPVLAVNSPEEVRCLNQIKRAAWMMAHDRRIKKSEFPKEITALLKEQQIAVDSWAIDADTYKIDARKLIELFDLLSKDDTRVDDASKVARFLDNNGYPVVTWESVGGFDNNAGGAGALAESFAMLTDREKFPPHCVVVFKDAHHHLNSSETPIYRRSLRNLAETNVLVGTEIRRLILLLQPDWVPHKDIDHCVTFVDFPLPDVEQLDREISYAQVSAGGAARFPCDDELRHQLCHALRGFTQIEAQNALFYCLAKHGRFETDMLKTIYRLKAAAVGKDDVLQIIDNDLLPDFNHFGGFENYMEFIDEVDTCTSKEAQKLGIKFPKGCTIVGIPGTGKSRIAMATARRLRKPLIKFELGAVFGSLVGQSEATMRLALKRITAQGPCVLLIDEADKAFGGVVSSADPGDSGVSRRVFGRLLSWMANENKEAFVIMTMNRTLGVPPEILRAGRLDATFYTTFPSDQDREEIIKIHLGLNGVNHDKLGFTRENWASLVKMTENFVGAELEQLVLKAIRSAFRKRKKIEPSMQEFEEARQAVSPMAVIDKAGIDEIDRWCKDRAIPVSKTKKAARTINIGMRRSLGDPLSN